MLFEIHVPSYTEVLHFCLSLSPSLPPMSISLVRTFSVRCGASYNDDNDASVECSTQSADSEPIVVIYYTINGGSRRRGEHAE